MKSLLEKYPHLWFQSYWVIYLLWFFALEAVAVPKYIIHSALDDIIPFCEWFVFPYGSWFVMLAWSFLLLWLTDTKSYDKLCLMAFSGMTMCLIVYMIWPNALNLRPEVLPRENIASDILKLAWKVDTPTNVCPSIHCQTSAAMVLAVNRSKKMEGKKAAQWLVALWGAVICLSTVFTKQHSIIDVVLGVAMVVPWYFILYRGKEQSKKETPVQAAAR